MKKKKKRFIKVKFISSFFFSTKRGSEREAYEGRMLSFFS